MEIKQGDVIVFKPEWQDAGDDKITFRALEDAEDGRVLVIAEVGLPINPTSVVSVNMVAEVKSDAR